MSKNTQDQVGSYIVRDKKGTYMSAYSEKLGKSQAVAWATECAKQSRGVIYYRATPEVPEEEMASFLDYGKKKSPPNKNKKES